MKAVRIKYWVQDTDESGHWELTGLIPKPLTHKWMEYFNHKGIRAKVIDNEEDY